MIRLLDELVARPKRQRVAGQSTAADHERERERTSVNVNASASVMDASRDGSGSRACDDPRSSLSIGDVVVGRVSKDDWRWEDENASGRSELMDEAVAADEPAANRYGSVSCWYLVSMMNVFPRICSSLASIRRMTQWMMPMTIHRMRRWDWRELIQSEAELIDSNSNGRHARTDTIEKRILSSMLLL